MLIAHPGRPPAPHDLWGSWNLDPLVLVPLAVAGWLYVAGIRGMPRALRPSIRRVACCGVAAALIVVALVSPLDALGTALASGHMVQHLLLTSAIAPLLVFGRPWQVIPWGVERELRKKLARRRRSLVRLSKPIANVWVAAGAFILALTVWHGSTPYEAALESPFIHAGEHAAFLVTGVMFWGAVGRTMTKPSGPDGSPVLVVFLVAMHGVFLSALMTFAGTAWYPWYTATAPAWGLDALADQHLAGVIMWVWGTSVSVGAVVTSLVRWIAATDERSDSAVGMETPAPLR